jgi:DNA-binding NarL/FixJ family response regulator
MLVEDNAKLRDALARGLTATGAARVTAVFARGEDALVAALEKRPDCVLMDVRLEGKENGIQAAVALRRELPRLPVVFYSIQDDDAYYRDFLRSGILSHYAYVKKSNYLLPELIVPLLDAAVAGQGFIDPEIEARVDEVRIKDAFAPLGLLEPNEQQVARLLARGLSNEQIAARMGFKDKRTIARTNGQIYAAWGLADSSADEKTARTRAAIIVRTGRLLRWDAQGTAREQNEKGEWVEWAERD